MNTAEVCKAYRNKTEKQKCAELAAHDWKQKVRDMLERVDDPETLHKVWFILARSYSFKGNRH